MSYERVVAARGKLDETKAVAERIGEPGHSPKGSVLRTVLDLCPRPRRLEGRRIEIRDDDVDVDGRPMPLVAARLAAGTDGPWFLSQEIQRHGPSEELQDVGAEAASDREAECVHVEAFGHGEIGHVDVQEDHRMT